MITPKLERPSKKDDSEAYNLATARDENTCQRCLRDCGPIARDHRQNRMPGNTIASNLQALGLRCHVWKTEHPADALAEGWAVPRWANPHEWPARRWVPTSRGTVLAAWVIYDDAGGWVEIPETEAFQRMGIT